MKSRLRTILSRRNRLVFFGLVLLLAALLAFVFRGLVHDFFVVPFLYALWLIGVLLESIPQHIIWIIFLIVAVRIVVGNLIALRKRAARAARRKRAQERGHIGTWTNRIKMAELGLYSKWRLSQELGQLLLGVLAQGERLTPEQVKQNLEAGGIDVPPEIRAYLQAALEPGSPDAESCFEKLRRWSRPETRRSPLYLDPEKVIRFLEYQMGVRHDY